MLRRQFLSSSLAASALSLTASGQAPQTAGRGPEYYQLRKYTLRSGPGPKMTETYFSEALIPALNRMGMMQVGAFSVDIGPQTPTYYLLMASPSLETLVTVDLMLGKDPAFLNQAGPFWMGNAASPAFVRVEGTLMRAFEGRPMMMVPPGSTKTKRIFQLRTYESPSYGDHARKIEMFHSGEFDFFTRAGCTQIFYGDTMVGPRTPSLTYMLSFADMNELNAKWDLFRNDPDWKKLSSNPRYAFEQIVSDIDNLILRPLACSQV